MRAASALISVVARRPAVAGGVAAFVVVFGFIAANALWYQPGRHPSPLFRTRDAEDFTAMAGLRRSPMIEADPTTVTTFRIERETTEAEPRPPAATGGDSIAAIIEQNDDPALVRAVQIELQRLRLYLGAVDGVSGQGTSAAVSAFQKSRGLAETGSASPELLAALQATGQATGAPGLASAPAQVAPTVPLQRPAADSLSTAEDPVAAAIRQAEQRQVPVPPKPVPGRPAAAKPAPAAANQQASRQTPATSAVADANLVMSIQKGLSNIAYADVSVDGVAGEQTRAAIRHFERHYRLPETGEPNPQVLKKLRDIGAL